VTYDITFLENPIYYVLIVLVIVEIIVNRIWNKAYFTKGLQILVLRIPVMLRHINIPSQSQLEARFRESWVTSSLLFKELATNTYGFREKSFEVRLVGYIPIMHGMLFFDFDNNQVVVKGFINWASFYFSLIWISAGILKFPWTLTIAWEFILIFLFGTIYWYQRSRYFEVAKFAAQMWSRKYQQ